MRAVGQLDRPPGFLLSMLSLSQDRRMGGTACLGPSENRSAGAETLYKL